MIEEKKKTKKHKKVKHRKKFTAEQRAQHVAAYRASGKSQAQYAAEVGIKFTTLNNWLYRNRKAEASRPVETPKSWWLCFWPWGRR